MRSQLPLRSATNRTRAKTLDHSEIFVSSRDLDWRGIYLEGGINEGWEAEDVTVDGHYVAVNLADEPLPMMNRTRAGWARVIIPSKGLWVHPEGLPFTLRVEGTAHWLGAVIDGDHMDALMGAHFELIHGYGVEDRLLIQLMLTLVEAANQHPPARLAVVQPTINALVIQAAVAHGQAAKLHQDLPLDAIQIQEITAWVSAHLAENLTVQQMAERVKLSPGHFARSFKKMTGESPWSMVIRLRLEEARLRLTSGAAVSEAAFDCGFADQAHLSRLFKASFGLTPGAFIKMTRT